MIRKLRWFFQRRQTGDDIEGRCERCGKRLKLVLTVLSKNEILILAIPCKDHPEDVMILWPQREDISTDKSKYLELFDKPSTVVNPIYRLFRYCNDKMNGVKSEY